eukprot:TRINITY_DN18052_c0_g1_i1.p1 TRINITY_DN18052_c0_g1~~TRINITY_DN18052_c0_g1_i1.p1  ORF type:complete len:543 (+),score=109.52 TRINITY_DN18052_c0_g1_i1:197-1630(+)
MASTQDKPSWASKGNGGWQGGQGKVRHVSSQDYWSNNKGTEKWVRKVQQSDDWNKNDGDNWQKDKSWWNDNETSGSKSSNWGRNWRPDDGYNKSSAWENRKDSSWGGSLPSREDQSQRRDWKGWMDEREDDDGWQRKKRSNSYDEDHSGSRSWNGSGRKDFDQDHDERLLQGSGRASNRKPIAALKSRESRNRDRQKMANSRGLGRTGTLEGRTQKRGRSGRQRESDMDEDIVDLEDDVDDDEYDNEEDESDSPLNLRYGGRLRASTTARVEDGELPQRRRRDRGDSDGGPMRAERKLRGGEGGSASRDGRVGSRSGSIRTGSRNSLDVVDQGSRRGVGAPVGSKPKPSSATELAVPVQRQSTSGRNSSSAAPRSASKREQAPASSKRMKLEDVSGSARSSRALPTSIKVSGIPTELTSEEIRNAFEHEAGPVVDCEFNRGVAWITFKRHEHAVRAVDTFDHGKLNGRMIEVDLVDE